MPKLRTPAEQSHSREVGDLLPLGSYQVLDGEKAKLRTLMSQGKCGDLAGVEIFQKQVQTLPGR